MIKICKILKQIYSNDDYYIFSGWCGQALTVIYIGDDPPKPLKTVDYQLTGEMKFDKKHGNQLIVSEYKKLGKIKIQKPSYDHKYQ